MRYTYKIKKLEEGSRPNEICISANKICKLKELLLIGYLERVFINNFHTWFGSYSNIKIFWKNFMVHYCHCGSHIDLPYELLDNSRLV